MKKLYLNLQMFAEGTGGSAATGAEGDGFGSEGMAENTDLANPKGRKANPLANVVYGKAEEGAATTPSDTESPKTRQQAFEELIKGEYKEEFQKRTQGIINDRFKETKSLQEKLQSQETILKMLSDKYGVDSTDIKALTKAMEDDESYYEDEALRKGLSVEQLKELKRLERENEEFRKAQEAQARRENSDRIYAQWQEEAKAFSEKYGIELDLAAEVNTNPEFARILQTGVSVEGAYKAIHFDEMVSGAMAKTASVVKEKLSNSMQSRASRPNEGATSSNVSTNFKTDVSKLTRADRQEIARRVARGETIRF